MTSISLCMIVKNEEKYITECLSSVIDVVDEIIIVDTGSKDNTIPLAQEFNARIIQVPWQDDFSLARNESLKAATKDWILVIDADEKLSEESIPVLKAAIQRENIIAYLANMYLFYGKEKTETFQVSQLYKLFRNKLGIKYDGIIHEQITKSLQKIMQENNKWDIDAIDLNFIHFGYINYEQNIYNKAKRNIDLLQNALKNPLINQEEKTFYQINLGTNLLAIGDIREAKRLYKSILKQLKRENNLLLIQKDITTELYTNLIQIYLNEHKPERAFVLLKDAIKLFPFIPTFNYFLGRTYIQSQEYQKAIEVFEVCLKLKEKKTFNKTIPFDWNLLDIVPLSGIGFCYQKLGKIEEAKTVLEKALEINPDFNIAKNLYKSLNA